MTDTFFDEPVRPAKLSFLEATDRFLGKTVLVTLTNSRNGAAVDRIRVRCKALAVGCRYGATRVKVTPEAGDGSLWIDAARVEEA